MGLSSPSVRFGRLWLDDPNSMGLAPRPGLGISSAQARKTGTSPRPNLQSHPLVPTGVSSCCALGQLSKLLAQEEIVLTTLPLPIGWCDVGTRSGLACGGVSNGMSGV